MRHVRGKLGLSRRSAVRAAAACWLFTGCSLVTTFDAKPDAGKEPSEVKEHDGTVYPEDDEGDPVVVDPESDEGADAPTDVGQGQAPVAVVAPDAGSVRHEPTPVASAAPDAGAAPKPGPAPDAGSGAGQPPAGGTAVNGPDAGDGRATIKELIDDLSGERKGRAERVCRCPGAGQECARGALGKSSCLERGLELLSVTSEDGVRALLECLLPAERAYTDCVNRRLNCRDVESSMGTCTLEYDLASARCNTASLQGLSLQGLCSR